MNMQKFRQDHTKILGKINELRELVQSGIVENSDGIATMLVSMSSTIKLHLAAEDGFLYPTLASSADLEAAQIGKAFQAEMGGIASAYTVFAREWSTARNSRRKSGIVPRRRQQYFQGAAHTNPARESGALSHRGKDLMPTATPNPVESAGLQSTNSTSSGVRHRFD